MFSADGNLQSVLRSDREDRGDTCRDDEGDANEDERDRFRFNGRRSATYAHASGRRSIVPFSMLNL